MPNTESEPESNLLTLVRAACQLSGKQEAVKAALRSVSDTKDTDQIRVWAEEQLYPTTEKATPDLDSLVAIAEFLASKTEEYPENLLVAVRLYLFVGARHEKPECADVLVGALASKTAGDPRRGAKVIRAAEEYKSKVIAGAKKQVPLDHLIGAVLNRALSL